MNVLDYAYMFRSRADQYYFMYHPKSQEVLRDPFEKMHGLKFLFTHAELRGIQLGLSWEDKPTVTSIEQLAAVPGIGASRAAALGESARGLLPDASADAESAKAVPAPGGDAEEGSETAAAPADDGSGAKRKKDRKKEKGKKDKKKKGKAEKKKEKKRKGRKKGKGGKKKKNKRK